MNRVSADIAVYGATPGGIAAACCAADAGARVVLLHPGKAVGGHLTSGICTTECEHMLPQSFGGWMMSFLGELGRYYGHDFPIHRWEPHAALEIYQLLLDRAGVRVETGAGVQDSIMAGGRVASVRTTNGLAVDAAYWIDASYEGDLMAAAGVSYEIGREPVETYDESLAGIRFVDSLEEIHNSLGHANLIDEVWNINLKDANGEFIDGVTPPDPALLLRGAGDRKVMNYHYRVTVTRGENRVSFPRPPAYREERFELLARWLHAQPEAPLAEIVAFLNHPSSTYAQLPNGFTRVTPGEKWEMNNRQASILSLGHLGGQFDYPDGDEATRRRVIDDHYDHNAGLLYFLGNSSSVPEKLREETRRWGLPPDEFTDNDHWPYQPYIRETRRMMGAYVLRQSDILEDRRKVDAIFPNSHWIDSHHVERLALDENHFRNEGRIWKEVTEPYDIPYCSLVPRGEECTNLIVPGCVSSSHVAFCSVRLESTWMGLGEAAGRAAVLALEDGRDVQTIDVPTLQKALRANGVRI